MKRLRKRHIAAGGILTALGMGITLYIQVDRWIIERAQMKADLEHRQEVAECEESGGTWYRGDCIHATD